MPELVAQSGGTHASAPHPRRGSKHTRLAIAAVATCLGLTLSGCSATALQQQYQSGSNTNYISGNGWTEWKPTQRQPAVTFGGTTTNGSSWNSTNYRGKVVVVNFWYAGCAPCRVEASTLQSTYTKYASQGVTFVGINVRDGAAAANAFDQGYGVTYPSILDASSGKVQLAFAGQFQPNATPTTLVLDKTGRVLGRIEGPINVAGQESILDSFITTGLDEKGSV